MYGVHTTGEPVIQTVTAYCDLIFEHLGYLAKDEPELKKLICPSPLITLN